MALTFLGKTECRLCGTVVRQGDVLVTTSGSPVDEKDPLFAFYDATMHQTCFLSWNQRLTFIRKFNEHYEKHYRGIRYMREDGTIEDRKPRPGSQNNGSC